MFLSCSKTTGKSFCAGIGISFRGHNIKSFQNFHTFLDPFWVQLDQAVLLKIFLHHPADVFVAAAQPFFHHWLPCFRQGSDHHTPAIAHCLSQNFEGLIFYISLFHRSYDRTQNPKHLLYMFWSIQQTWFCESRCSSAFLIPVSAAPRFHFFQQ